uniref:Uncharacterized protein n=1 Tax=Meloidogyne enterolobii TaxID=390850 RepID=A0A6V7WN60_MELEN|nr:unnamed protein product [Meloidogyne enterolobii]
MKTPKQLEEWSFSTENSDNVKNKIGDETLVEEDNLTEKSCSTLETTSSIDGLSATCGSCCLSQNIIRSLKQRLKELELESKINYLSLENSNLKLQKEHENTIKNLKQNFEQSIEENNKKLKAENDISSSQKDEKIYFLEEEIKKLHNQSDDLIKLQTNFNNLELKFIEEKEKTLNLKKKNSLLENQLKEMDKKIQKINSANENKIEELKQDFQQLIEENNKKINNFEKGFKKFF